MDKLLLSPRTSSNPPPSPELSHLAVLPAMTEQVPEAINLSSCSCTPARSWISRAIPNSIWGPRMVLASTTPNLRNVSALPGGAQSTMQGKVRQEISRLEKMFSGTIGKAHQGDRIAVSIDASTPSAMPRKTNKTSVPLALSAHGSQNRFGIDVRGILLTATVAPAPAVIFPPATITTFPAASPVNEVDNVEGLLHVLGDSLLGQLENPVEKSDTHGAVDETFMLTASGDSVSIVTTPAAAEHALNIANNEHVATVKPIAYNIQSHDELEITTSDNLLLDDFDDEEADERSDAESDEAHADVASHELDPLDIEDHTTMDICTEAGIPAFIMASESLTLQQLETVLADNVVVGDGIIRSDRMGFNTPHTLSGFLSPLYHSNPASKFHRAAPFPASLGGGDSVYATGITSLCPSDPYPTFANFKLDAPEPMERAAGPGIDEQPAIPTGSWKYDNGLPYALPELRYELATPEYGQESVYVSNAPQSDFNFPAFHLYLTSVAHRRGAPVKKLIVDTQGTEILSPVRGASGYQIVGYGGYESVLPEDVYYDSPYRAQGPSPFGAIGVERQVEAKPPTAGYDSNGFWGLSVDASSSVSASPMSSPLHSRASSPICAFGAIDERVPDMEVGFSLEAIKAKCWSANSDLLGDGSYDHSYKGRVLTHSPSSSISSSGSEMDMRSTAASISCFSRDSSPLSSTSSFGSTFVPVKNLVTPYLHDGEDFYTRTPYVWDSNVLYNESFTVQDKAPLFQAKVQIKDSLLFAPTAVLAASPFLGNFHQDCLATVN